MERFQDYRSGLAYGPAPRLVLRDTQIKDLIEQAKTEGDPRKIEARHRFSVWRGKYHHLIEERLEGTRRSAKQIEEIKRFVSTANNLARDIARQVSVVWKQGAIRTIGKRARMTDAFNKTINAAHFDVHAPTWNQLAFLCGSITVLPVVRIDPTNGESVLAWDALLPHQYDIIRNPANPFGPPMAAAYRTGDGNDDDRRLNGLSRRLIDANQPQRANLIVVDAEVYRYYDTAAGGPHGAELLGEIEHHAGRFPGSTLRLEFPYGDTWYGGAANQRIIDAGVNINAIEATFEFIRKSQNKKLPTTSGDHADMPKRQAMDGETPMAFPSTSPETLMFEIHDFDTDPKNFIAHADYWAHKISSAYGGTARVVQGAGLLVSVEIPHEAQTEVRNEQIPFCRMFEHDLHQVTVAVSSGSNHTSDLPPADVVEDEFAVEYPQLSRTYANPVEQQEHIDFLLSHGFINRANAYRMIHNPLMPEKQAQQLIEHNIKSDLPIIELLTKRNSSLDPKNNPPPVVDETTAEQNGRAGGRISKPPGTTDEPDAEQPEQE